MFCSLSNMQNYAHEPWMTPEIKLDCQRKAFRCMSDIYALSQLISLQPNNLSLRTRLGEAQAEFVVHQEILKCYAHN